MNNYHEIERQLHSVRPRLTKEEQEFVWQRISGVLPQRKRERQYARRTVLIAVIAGLFGGTATVFASNEAVPGDILYPIDRGVEDARIAFATAEKKDTLRVEFANERYQEIKTIVKRETSKSPSAQMRVVSEPTKMVSTSTLHFASTTQTSISTSTNINVLDETEDEDIAVNEDKRIAQLVRDIKQAEKSVRDDKAKEEIRTVAGRARMVRKGNEPQDDSMKVTSVATTTIKVDELEQKSQRSFISRIEKKLRKNEEKRKKLTEEIGSIPPTVSTVSTSSTATSTIQVTKIEEPSSRWGRRHEWNGKQPVAKSENRGKGKSSDDQQVEHEKSGQVSSTTPEKTQNIGTTTLTQSAITTEMYPAESRLATTSTTTSITVDIHDGESTEPSVKSTSTMSVGGETTASSTIVGIVQSNITAIAESESVTITWKTNVPTKTELYYDDAPVFDRNEAEHVGDSEKNEIHKLKVDQLSPARTYRYQIRSEDGDGNKVYSPVHEFTTL